jgi:hypothetical protein
MPPKIVKEMAQTAWKAEQERIKTLKARLAAEDEAQQVLAKTNLAAASLAFELAEEGDKVLAERVLFRATVCEQDMRERKTGVTDDMKCSCLYVKGRGHSCALCDRWRQALYGGENWVKYGHYNGFLC